MNKIHLNFLIKCEYHHHCHFHYSCILWQPCLVPGSGAGVAAAAVSGRGSSRRRPVGSVEQCIVVCHRAPCRFEDWERSNVSATTCLKKRGEKWQYENERIISPPPLVYLLASSWGYIMSLYLRDGAFFPAELKTDTPLVFRLPVLLEELKSASLPTGWNRLFSLFSDKKHLRHCCTSAF